MSQSVAVRLCFVFIKHTFVNTTQTRPVRLCDCVSSWRSKMINDGMCIRRGTVLCYDSTSRFRDEAMYEWYQAVSHPVSMGCKLSSGGSAAFMYVLERQHAERLHLHLSSDSLRSRHGRACWRVWDPRAATLQPLKM